MLANFEKNWDCRAVQRTALCRSRRELSNACLLAKFGFDTAENEPCKVCLTLLRSLKQADGDVVCLQEVRTDCKLSKPRAGFIAQKRRTGERSTKLLMNFGFWIILKVTPEFALWILEETRGTYWVTWACISNSMCLVFELDIAALAPPLCKSYKARRREEA